MSTAQTWHRWHRWQHLYMWALYPFVFYLSALVAADLVYVVSGRVGHHRVEAPSVRRAGVLLVSKFKGPAVLVGVACVFRPALGVVDVYLLAALIMATVWALIIVVEHTVDTATFPVSEEGPGHRMAVGWAEAQVIGTADVAIRNPVVRWYIGSLNRHIEHHLFPRIAHVHLHGLAPVVRRVCAEHGVRYQEFPNLRSALGAHHRFLRELGRRPA